MVDHRNPVLKPDVTALVPPQFSPVHIPYHIAVSPEGNGRWAERRGLPRHVGHRQGEYALQEIIKGAIDIGVAFLSFHAFTTENWRRPAGEIESLMDLYADYIERRKQELHSLGVRIIWVGSPQGLPERLMYELKSAQELTEENSTLTFAFCVNYGGRDEILRAVNRVVEEARNGNLPSGQVDVKLFEQYLNGARIPDVDLFLRTGGEQRTSNFFLWQAAFSEMVFLDTLWPDMTRNELWKAVSTYASRERRLGGLPNAR
jgi:undecaprenyl diphosphate synthase